MRQRPVGPLRLVQKARFADRRAFIRKYFHADIADPLNEDMVLNTGVLTIDQGADAVCAVVSGRRPSMARAV